MLQDSRVDDVDPMNIDPPPRASLNIIAGVCYIPKDNDQKPAGDDAHFICSENCTIGVADGVGGWAKKGIDAGEYARELMTKAAIATLGQTKGSIVPRRILSSAYADTVVPGSSTACIVSVNDNMLHAVNIGDSGFIVFRENEVLYRSPTQQRSFNKPYQLGRLSDQPWSAMVMRVEVKAGDILVMGTDGLYDNMHASEILEVLKERKEVADPHELAWSIAGRAYIKSLDQKANTPFAVNSLHAGCHSPGGKADDITVIVAHIF